MTAIELENEQYYAKLRKKIKAGLKKIEKSIWETSPSQYKLMNFIDALNKLYKPTEYLPTEERQQWWDEINRVKTLANEIDKEKYKARHSFRAKENIQLRNEERQQNLIGRCMVGM